MKQGTDTGYGAGGSRRRILSVIPGTAAGNSMPFARTQASLFNPDIFETRTFFFTGRVSPAEILRNFRSLRKTIWEFKPGLIHVHYGTVTGLVSVLAAGKVPVLITYHGSDLNPAAGSGRLRAFTGHIFSQLAALGASSVICVSEELKKRLWWRRDVVSVLPCGADTAVFTPEERGAARSRIGWSMDEKVVLFNRGREDQAVVKGADLARDVLSRVSARAEILDGSRTPREICTLMNASDCLLVTSLYEGSPVIVKEAMACNLPVVSAEAGDIPEMLRRFGGGTVVSRDPDDMAKEIERVLAAGQRSSSSGKIRELDVRRVQEDLEKICLKISREGR